MVGRVVVMASRAFDTPRHALGCAPLVFARALTDNRVELRTYFDYVSVRAATVDLSDPLHRERVQ